MFFAEEDLTLHITRGDTGEITVRAVDVSNDGNEAPYIFKAGEVLRLKVYEKKNCSVVVLQKDFPIVKETETVTLALEEADTKIGDTISKPVDYWYEIELNPFTEPQTIVGYDEDGAKILRLYPEGQDTEVIPPTEEELGTVDKELDLTSERAIQNQAVARAIVQLESTVEKNNETATEEIVKTKKDVALLNARVTNLATMEAGSTTADAEIVDARVGYDGTVYDSLGNAIRGQATDIAPTRMHLSGDAWKGEKISTTFVSDKYYKLTTKGGTPTETATTNGIGMVNFPCVSGEKYLIYNGANITTSIYKQMFVPLSDGKCAVSGDDIVNYVEVYDSQNFVYLVTIPEDATDFYFATRNQAINIEKVYGEYNIEWLKLKPSNFTKKSVPLSALQEKIEYKYGNCVAKPLNLGGSLVAFGDSIADGVKSPDNLKTKSFIQQFAESRGLTFTKLAYSGSTITDEDSQPNSIYKRVTTTTYSGDTIVVAGGVNDYVTQKVIGDYNSLDITTFYGALRGICSHLQTNHPNATVIFITPIATTRKPTEETAPLNAYRNAIFEVATEFGFNVVNGLEMNFPDEIGNYHDFMMTDGVHPTVVGHKLYANSLMGILG